MVGGEVEKLVALQAKGDTTGLCPQKRYVLNLLLFKSQVAVTSRFLAQYPISSNVNNFTDQKKKFL